MEYRQAMEQAQFIDKKLDKVVIEMFEMANSFDRLGLFSLATDTRSNAEKYRMLQLILSKALAKQFQECATSGKAFVAPKVLNDFSPERVKLSC